MAESTTAPTPEHRSGAPAPKPPLWTRAFVSLLVAQAGFGYAFSSFLLLPKFVTTELGGGPVAIGRLMAVSGVAVVVCLLIAGVLVDRCGRRRFLAAGGVLMAAASLGFTAVERVDALLYALRAVQCLAFAFVFAAGSALCAEEAPAQRLGQALGVLGLSFVAMGAIGPSVVEALVSTAGWDAAFALAAAGALACALLSASLRARPPTRDGSPEIPMRQLVARPDQLRSGLVVGLVGMAMGTAFTFNQPFALELGIEDVSRFFVANTSAALFVRLGLGPYLDGFGRRRVVVASLVVYALAIAAMAALRQLGLVVLGLGLGLAHGAFYPMFVALVVSEVSARERGRVMSILQAWFNVGVAGGSLALGELAARVGYPPIFVAAAAGVLLALGIVLHGRRQPAPALAVRVAGT